MSTSSDVMPAGVSAAGVKGPGNWSLRCLLIGIVFSLLSLFGLLFTTDASDPSRPFLGYMLAVVYWLSILIGMQFLIMLWWMFDAGWSVIIRRQFEHMISALPWLGVLLLPLVIMGLVDTQSGKVAWVWMSMDAPVAGTSGTVADDVLYLHKAPYLNNPFFLLRFFIYFAVWAGLAWAFRTWSFRMDATGDHKYVHRSRVLAAFGLFLSAMATTFASIDWFMTLNYHWFSTMFGVWYFSAAMRAALAAGVLVLFYMGSRTDGLKGIVNSAHYHFMGCLMLAFTVFWAYISFSQYFLIYNANIPEETFWYNIREMNKDGTYNSWWWISMALIFAYFLFPFLYLLWHRNKQGNRLKFIAIWILVFHFIDLYWNIMPQKLWADNEMGYDVRYFTVSWIDVTMFIGVGGIVLWSFLRSASQERPIPIRDPRIKESLNYHE
ncbi:MAG: hypothetical protein JJU20_06700 [Opitutales bacterium]|nr:hypothetical protein [Opitutales bacterium]